MKTYRILLTTLGFISATLLFSCEESSTSDLQDVQLCLNKAEQGAASACVQKIAGDTSPLAYSLRCSAIFIDQGFGDAASFVDALDSINGGTGCSGTCSSTVAALTSLSFASGDLSDSNVRNANNAAAEAAFANCSKADAKIYTQIASLFQLGTLTTMAAATLGGGVGSGPGGSFTDSDIQAALTDPAVTPAVVGTIVTITYENTCANTEDASDSTKEYCAQLQTAIAGGATPADIGSCLLNTLKTPGYVCP